MNKMNNDFVIQKAKNADCIEVISRFIELKKAGNSYVGLCPFHNEKTPSFHVYKDRYKCFGGGCGVSGSAIDFVMNYKKVEFLEAVEIITGEKFQKIKKEKVKTPLALQVAQELFKSNSSSVEFKQFLSKRSLSKESIESFDLGFSPFDDQIKGILSRRGFSTKELSEVSLMNKVSGAFSYKGRITIPLHDEVGNLIGFAGREYLDKNGSSTKYLNPSNNSYYEKSSHLFNFHRAKYSAKYHDQIFIVEGYLDVIRLNSLGMKNVVSLSSTSINQSQIDLIKKEGIPKVILMLDGDDAGKKSLFPNIKLLLENGLDVAFKILPDGMDPDDYFQSKLPKDIYQLEENDGLSFYLNSLKKDKKPGFDGYAETIGEIKKIYTKYPNKEYLDELIQELFLVPENIF